jgi:large subunit ribosomal protein L4
MSPEASDHVSPEQEPDAAGEPAVTDAEQAAAAAPAPAVADGEAQAPAGQESTGKAGAKKDAAGTAGAKKDDADTAGAKKEPAAKAAAKKEPAAKAGATKEGAAKPAAAKGAGKGAATAAAKGAATAAAKGAKASAPSRAVAVDLPAHIFDAKVNVPLIHQVVVAQQAAARQGTHATKTRADVRGGGRKPYRQKGTGRARQGSTRAPQFTGGGVVHGPVPRSHAMKAPKKMKVAALRGALSDRARHGLVQVVDAFVDGAEPRTREALAVLTGVTGYQAGTTAVLIVAERSDQLTWKSLRNIPGVHMIDPGQLNTYDVLVSDRVVFTSAAFESFVASSAPAREDGQP